MTDFFGRGTFGSWQTTYAKDQMYSNLLPVNFAPFTVGSYIGGNMYTKGNIITPFLNALLGVRVITSAGIGAVTQGAYYVLHYTMNAPDNSHVMMNFLEESNSPWPALTPAIVTPTVAPSSNNTVVWQATGNYPTGLLVFQSNSNVPSMTISNISLFRANVTINNPVNNYIFQYNASKSSMSLPLSGSYQDAAGNTYTGSVTIPAYGSVVLLKKT
jgi:hypothetical protein